MKRSRCSALLQALCPLRLVRVTGVTAACFDSPPAAAAQQAKQAGRSNGGERNPPPACELAMALLLYSEFSVS